MRFSWLLGLLVASLAVAQSTPSAAPAQAPPKATSTHPAGGMVHTPPAEEEDEDKAPPAASNSAVPESAPVITVKGVCDTPAPAKAGAAAKAGAPAVKGDCKTVITRAEFEKLANALQPNMPLQVKKQLAGAYPRLLAMSHEAHKRGLDKTPQFQERIKWARMQVLTQDLNRQLQTDADQVSDKEVADYYQKNQAAFEQATLERIFVPKSKLVESKEGESADETKAKQQAAEDAMTKEAESLRTQAAAGEDFEKLQKTAFETAELKGNPPSSNLGKVRRNNIPPTHVSVFDLKPGEISQLINDAPSGHYIYKLISKDIQPVDQVKDEIHNTLKNQRMRDMTQAIQNSSTSELNEAYFGPPGPPTPPGPPRPGMRPPSQAPKPPAQ